MKTRGRERSVAAGMTVVELLIAVAIIGILANIAIPAYTHQLRKARATSVINDFVVFRKALLEYSRDSGDLPPDTYPGRGPRQLRPYLKGSFRWSRPDLRLRYDWENWKLPNGEPKHRRTGVLYGLSVTTDDIELVDAIGKAYDGPFWYTLGRNYTFVIEAVGD